MADYLQEISVEIQPTCSSLTQVDGQICGSSDTGNVCNKDEVGVDGFILS